MDVSFSVQEAIPYRVKVKGFMVGHKSIQGSDEKIFRGMRRDIHIDDSDRLPITQKPCCPADPIVGHYRESLSWVAAESHSAAEREYIATLQSVGEYVLSDSPESVESVTHVHWFTTRTRESLGYRESSYIFEKLGEMGNNEFMPLTTQTIITGGSS